MSDSEEEIFNIKDPRPLTAKQREGGLEDILSVFNSPDQNYLDLESPSITVQETANKQGSAAQDQSDIATPSCTSPNKRSKSRKKDKHRKKGSKRGASSSTQSFQTSVDQDVIKTTSSTPNFKALKKAKSDRPVKKKTTHMTKSEQKPNVTGRVEIESINEQKRAELKSDSSNRSDPGLEKYKKSNLEFILKLAKTKRCSRVGTGHCSSWSNPALAEDTVDNSNYTTPMETSQYYSKDIPVQNIDDNISQMEGSSKIAVQIDVAPEIQCPKIRYTNLSLSMPNTREGRRGNEDDEAGNSWLFECKNIWSNSRKAHHYNGYQKNQTVELRDKYNSYTPSKNEVAFQPVTMNTGKSSSRFIYSMKNRVTHNRSSTMRTVKQGSFVLMGTVKTIRDDRDKFAFNF